MNDPLPKAVAAIVTLAEQRAGKDADNITALAMTWNMGETATNNVSTLSSPPGAVTLQMDAGSGAQEADLSDDDIEKAISDIRNALAKSNRPPS